MDLSPILIGIAKMIPYSAIGLLALWTAYQWHTRFPTKYAAGLAKADNTAAGIRMAGVFIAIGIGLSGIFEGSTHAFAIDLVRAFAYSMGMLVIIYIAQTVNDKLVLRSIDNSAAIARNNVAVALVEFGGLLATGLIARGAVMGQGSWETFAVFFILGQALLVACVWVFEKLGRAPLVNEAEQGNVAAGILLGGNLWAYGLILAAAVAGNFHGWSYDISAFALTACAGLVFLYIADWAVDLIIITDYHVTDIVSERLVRPALWLSGAKIGMAYVISTVAV